jgi:hypothetical protein
MLHLHTVGLQGLVSLRSLDFLDEPIRTMSKLDYTVYLCHVLIRNFLLELSCKTMEQSKFDTSTTAM